jgi:hypothetical protein
VARNELLLRIKVEFEKILTERGYEFRLCPIDTVSSLFLEYFILGGNAEKISYLFDNDTCPAHEEIYSRALYTEYGKNRFDIYDFPIEEDSDSKMMIWDENKNQIFNGH